MNILKLLRRINTQEIAIKELSRLISENEKTIIDYQNKIKELRKALRIIRLQKNSFNGALKNKELK